MHDSNDVRTHYAKADKTILIVLYLTFIYALGLASMHDTWGIAFIVGGATVLLATAFYKMNGGKRLTRLWC